MQRIIMVLAAAAALASAAGAQDNGSKVPADAMPPKGMCRIWIEGVPVNKQPAPTDCATAVKNRPANGRVIFGEGSTRPADKPVQRDTPSRGYVPPQRPPVTPVRPPVIRPPGDTIGTLSR